MWRKTWFIATTLAALIFEITLFPVAWLIREDPRDEQELVITDDMILDVEDEIADN